MSLSTSTPDNTLHFDTNGEIDVNRYINHAKAARNQAIRNALTASAKSITNKIASLLPSHNATVSTKALQH